MNVIITDNLVYNRQILVTILRGCINRKNRKLKTKETKSLNNDDLRQSTEAEKKNTSSPFINLTFAEPSIIS